MITSRTYHTALPLPNSMLSTRLPWDVLHEAGKAIQRATKEHISTQNASTWQVGKRLYLISGSPSSPCNAFFTGAGKLDRDDGPAVILVRRFPSRDRPGKIELHWYSAGVRHRPDGPAVLVYDDREHVIGEQWWLHGQPHRLDGPALIATSVNGKHTETWYLDGKKSPPLPRIAAAIRDRTSLADALVADLARLDHEHYERIMDAYREILGEEAYREVSGNFFLV